MTIARKIVEYAINSDSSDIHLEENSPIAIRSNSDIKIIDKVLGSTDMDALLLELLGVAGLDVLTLSLDLG